MSPRRTNVDAAARSDLVVEWRRGRLLEAGFAADQAGEIANDSGIDLHLGLDLIDRGCPPELAARILAPLDGEHMPCWGSPPFSQGSCKKQRRACYFAHDEWVNARPRGG
jgi:hypothetical protein